MSRIVRVILIYHRHKPIDLILSNVKVLTENLTGWTEENHGNSQPKKKRADDPVEIQTKHLQSTDLECYRHKKVFISINDR
jgi:hypothetical protein